MESFLKLPEFPEAGRIWVKQDLGELHSMYISDLGDGLWNPSFKGRLEFHCKQLNFRNGRQVLKGLVQFGFKAGKPLCKWKSVWGKWGSLLEAWWFDVISTFLGKYPWISDAQLNCHKIKEKVAGVVPRWELNPNRSQINNELDYNPWSPSHSGPHRRINAWSEEAA